MTNNKNLKDMLIEIENAGFNIYKTLIWAKNSPITNMYYMDSHEYIVFCRKGKAKRINNCGTKSVLNIDNPRNKVHPTEKPIELMEIFINNSSNEGEIVLDPFMGGGSTGIAAIRNGRKFIGIEIDEEYFKIAEKRINDHIAEKARNEMA
jgi:site-specific DNA-methyltransferase (adenine-specific)